MDSRGWWFMTIWKLGIFSFSAGSFVRYFLFGQEKKKKIRIHVQAIYYFAMNEKMHFVSFPTTQPSLLLRSNEFSKTFGLIWQNNEEKKKSKCQQQTKRMKKKVYLFSFGRTSAFNCNCCWARVERETIKKFTQISNDGLNQ